jgi:transposase
MKQLTAEAKHEILREYRSDSPAHSFAALARRHAVAGGRDVLRRWYARWNGTAASLQRGPQPGRPHSLTAAEVQHHITTPIRRKNRAHAPVHYTDLVTSVREGTGKKVSLRTVQRYGKEEAKGKMKHGKKRTADERQCTG